MTSVAAVDLGASSLRVALVELETFSLEVVHRHPHGPVRAADGSLRWDWARLIDEIEHGLALAADRVSLSSIGIDTWGVDYGLLDVHGALVSPPYSYRDDRIAPWTEIANRLGRERLYQISGIQLMGINTLFQLAVHDRSEIARASHVLMLPELVAYHLTREHSGEHTSAGTTGLVDLRTGTWSEDLLNAIGIDASLMSTIADAGTPIGKWKGIPLHLVGGHDTASALAAAGDGDSGFVSSGTWMVVGVERRQADTSPAAMQANFSNEPAVFGGVRFLKNVMGLWLLERLRAEWGNPPLDELLVAAGEARPLSTFDSTNQRFLAPTNMEAEVRKAARLPQSASRAEVARCVLEALAEECACVFSEIAVLTDESVAQIRVFGGGVRNELLNRLIEERVGSPVRRGPTEATALGNAAAQGIALGLWSDLEHARDHLARVRGES